MLFIDSVNATDFDQFQTPDFDATSVVENSETEDTPWKNQFKFSTGINDQNNIIINRLSWRPQWQGLQDEYTYWSIDAKLRVYDQQDMQFDSSQELDYDLNILSLYLQKTYTKSSLKAGYQTLALGYMDLLTVSNIFTPQDFSEPLFIDPEDSKIGQPIINWSWYSEKRQIDLYINLYPAENRYPVSNLEQILTDFLGTNNFTLNDGLPDAGSEPEVLIKIQSQNDKHEYQWIIASLLQNDPNLKPVSLSIPVIFTTEYPRYEMLAGAYSYTKGNHQLKTEASYKNGLKPIDAGNLTIHETALALGWEYNANGNYTLTIESVKTWREIPGQSAGLIAEDIIETDLDQTVASFRKNFLNETVSLTILFGNINPGDINITSLAISYTPVDDLIFELIATEIDSDDNQYNIFTSSTLVSGSYHW